MPVHILGKAIKHNSVVSYGLAETIFGVGKHTAEKICAKVGIYPKMRMNQLSEPQIMSINKELSEILVEGHLRQKVQDDIRMKIRTGSYAGTRHVEHLPVRGQGTRTNARTARRLNRPDRKV